MARLDLLPKPDATGRRLQYDQGSSQSEIRCASAKWIARYRVKRALVLNPGTPVEISLRLLPFLNAQDLKLVADSGNLPDTLTKAAAGLRRRI